MLFSSDNGEELEFKVLGYQYPDNFDGDWDGNWLRIYIRVVSQTGSWRSVDPSLTTWELKEAINWFKTILDPVSEIESELTFTEPNLTFEFVNRKTDLVQIKIHFALESRPQSASEDQDYFIDLTFPNSKFEKAINDLQIEYENYPERPAEKQ